MEPSDHDREPDRESLEPQHLAPGELYRVAWILYMVLALAGIGWIGLREREVPLSLFVDPSAWWLDVGLGLAAAALLLGVWEVGRRVLPQARLLEERLGEVLGSIAPTEALALAVLSGFAEELFFRGAVQGAFSSWGWLWSSVLFALLHSGPERPFRLWTLFAFVAGLTFAGLMAWRGNLLAPVVAHFAVNAINLRRMAGRASLEAPPPGDESPG